MGFRALGIILVLLTACGPERERPSSNPRPNARDSGAASDGGEASDAAEGSHAGQADGSTGMDALAGDARAQDAAGDGGPVPDAGNGAPVFLDLTTNVTTLRSDQRLIVTAVLTDPDGVDDLIGGLLIDPATGGSYGAFATSAAEGSYQLDLGWTDLDTVAPIDAPITGAPRTFRARFFDAAGNLTARDFTLDLRCADDAHSACAGDCVDLDTDELHCGACGQEVTITGATCLGGAPACADGSLDICGSECVSLDSIDHCGDCSHACPSWPGRSILCQSGGTCSVQDSFYSRISCETICGNRGYDCVSARWWYYMSSGYGGVDGACADVPPEMLPSDPGSSWESVSCRCVHLGSTTCAASPEDTAAACSDGCLNDGDQWSDCEDFDCCPVVICPSGTACNP